MPRIVGIGTIHITHGLLDPVDPRPATLRALDEIFVAVPGADIKVSRAARGNNGVVTVGDVIICMEGDERVVGGLLADVSVHNVAFSVVAVWTERASEDGDARIGRFVPNDDVQELPIRSVDCACYYRPSADGSACAILIPKERRR